MKQVFPSKGCLKTLSKNKLRMRLTVNYFLIDVKQIIYLSTLFAAEPEVMTT
jgi:hypothetical protein